MGQRDRGVMAVQGLHHPSPGERAARATLPLQQQPATAQTEPTAGNKQKTGWNVFRGFTLPWSATDNKNCFSPKCASKCVALDHLLRQHRYKS